MGFFESHLGVFVSFMISGFIKKAESLLEAVDEKVKDSVDKKSLKKDNVLLDVEDAEEEEDRRRIEVEERRREDEERERR